MTPATSPNDPATSAQAEARHTRSGKRATHCAMVLELVRHHPGLTGQELWRELTEMERRELVKAEEIYKRLNDLKHAGKVRQGDSRKCAVKGREMVTWWVEVIA